jgi:hypothetical protein
VSWVYVERSKPADDGSAARLARSLRDLAVRICNEVDQEGINTWASTGCAEWTPTSRSPDHFASPEQPGEPQSRSPRLADNQAQLVGDPH